MFNKIKNKKILLCAVIILELIIMGVSGAILSRSHQTADELSFTQDNLFYESGESGFYLDKSLGHSYVLTPEFVLPKGFYTIYAEYEYRGQIRLEVVHPDGRMNSNISGSIASVNQTEAFGDFKVRYSDRILQVRGRMAGDASEGDYMLIRNLRIVPNHSLTIRNILFYLAVCILLTDMILLLILYRDRLRMTDEQITHLKALVVLTILVSVPLMVNYLFGYQHDLKFHLTRIEGLKEGLLDGIFPVKMQSYWLHGHGYPVSIFYGDLLLYIPAVLRIFGVSIQAAYNFYVLMINAGTVFIAYYCFSKMSNARIGLICTTVFSFNIFRLVDIYRRAAVGEYTAIMFMPLVLYGMWRIYTLPEDGEEYRKSWIPLTIGCVGVFHTHILSTEMIAVFMVITAVILWKKTFRRETLIVLTKAAVSTILLSLWLLIPFLDYWINGVYIINKHSDSGFALFRQDERGVFIAQLFMNRHSVAGGSFGSDQGTVLEMPLTVGLASMLVLLGWFIFCCGKKRDRKEKREELLAVFLCIASLAMTLYCFPYFWFAGKFPFLQSLIGSIQYPWRYLSIAGVLLVWLLSIVLRREWIEHKKKQMFVYALISISFWQGISYMSDVLNEASVDRVFQLGNLSTMDVEGGEYLPLEQGSTINPDEYIKAYVDQLTYNEEAISISEWHRDKGNVEVSLVNLTQQTQQIEVPLIDYKGYHAYTGSGEELEISPGTSYRISVSVPAGYSGTLRVEYVIPWYWRVGELISLFTLLSLILCPYIKEYIKKRRNNASVDNLVVDS